MQPRLEKSHRGRGLSHTRALMVSPSARGTARPSCWRSSCRIAMESRAGALGARRSQFEAVGADPCFTLRRHADSAARGHSSIASAQSE